MLAACSSGGTDNNPPPAETPTIGIGIAPTGLVLQNGTSGPIAVTVSRGGGYTGAITLSLESAPTGVTGTFSPQSVPSGATASTLTVVVASGAVAGSYQLTIRASGTGVTDKTATLSLTVSPAPSGSYALSIAPTLVSVTQGQSGQATVTIERSGGYAGPVALSASGAPAGLTVTLNPASATGASSAIGLTASGTLAPGDYLITVTGTVSGLADRTATMTVRLVASPPPGGNVTFTFCGAAGTNPIWLAVQDGAGAWTRVTSLNDSYTFSINAGKGGVSWVTSVNSNNFSQATILGTTTELQAFGAAQCPTGKTINGSVAGVAAPNLAYVSLGGSSTVVSPAVSGGFALAAVPDGARDLLATRTTTVFQGPTALTGINRMIVRRGLNVPSGGSLAALDFNAAEAFDPDTKTLSIINLGAEVVRLTLGYATANSGTGIYLTDANPSGLPSRSWWGVPGAKQATGDLHAVTVSATPGVGLPFTQQRSTQLFTAEARDRSIVLGPTPSPVTLTVAATGPVRFRIQFLLQGEYNRFFATTFAQSLGGAVRNSNLTVSAGWLPVANAGTTVDVTMPDFSGTAGWSGSWGLLAGFQAAWTHTALGWTAAGGILGSPLVDGGLVQTGAVTGQVTP